jgi:hypothetical protein
MLVTMNRGGTLTIPEALRTGLAGDEQVFEAVRRADGVIELRPRKPADRRQPAARAAAPAGLGQAEHVGRLTETPPWLPVDSEPAAMTAEQEQMEREADAAIAAGRVTRSDDVERFITRLESLGSSQA